jgi:hypothetical protein
MEIFGMKHYGVGMMVFRLRKFSKRAVMKEMDMYKIIRMHI